MIATTTVDIDAAIAGVVVVPIGANIPAAIGIAKKLYLAPQMRFYFILRIVLCANSMKDSMSPGSDCVKITSAESIATNIRIRESKLERKFETEHGG